MLKTTLNFYLVQVAKYYKIIYGILMINQADILGYVGMNDLESVPNARETINSFIK